MNAASRAASVIFLYFAVALVLPLPLPISLVLLTAGLCALGCGLAECTAKRGALRYVWAVLPLLALIPADNIQRALIALPILYSLVLICTDRLYAEIWGWRTYLIFSMPPALLYLCVSTGLLKSRAEGIFLCGILYFFFGVYAMRQLRMGPGVGLKGHARETLAVLILPLLAGVLTLLLFSGLDQLAVLGIGIVTAFGMILQAVITLFARIEMWKLAVPSQELSQPTQVSVPETEMTEAPEILEEPWSDYRLLENFFRLALLVLVLVVLFFLIRALIRLLRRPASGAAQRTWSEESEAITTERRETPKQIASNRREIRRIYAKYLVLVEGRGFVRRRADTSREVLDAGYALADESRALREIYIRARYAAGDPVSSADVKTAKELLRAIRAETRNK